MRSHQTTLLGLMRQYFNARFDLSPKTVRNYRDQFVQFDSWCRGRSGRKVGAAVLDDLKPAVVEEFVAHRMKYGVRTGKKGSEHQAAKAVIALKSLATFLA